MSNKKIIKKMAGTIKGRCDQDVPYTGRGRCAKSEGTTRALLLTNTAARYSMDEEIFINDLQKNVTTTGILRMLPIKGVRSVAASGGEVETSDVGFGGTLPVGLSAYSEVYQLKGDDCLYKELVKMNKREMRVLRIDDEQYIYGTVKTINKEDYMQGFMATVYVYEARANDTDSKSIYVGIYYDESNERESKNKHAFFVGDIPDGLIPVKLIKVQGGAKVVHTCSGSDYTHAYGENWDVCMFAKKNDGTNPAEVTYDEETGCLTFTPSGSYRILSVSELEKEGIFDLEGVEEYAEV